jgi:hypothetical protein
LAKEGGCPISEWGSWEAKLVEEGKEEEGAGRNFCHANIIGRLHSCQIQVNNVRERHNIHVNRYVHDVEEKMSKSDFDDDKNRSRYI